MIFNIQLSMVTASHSFSREDQHRALCMCYSKHLKKKRGEGIPKGMGTQHGSLDTWSQQVQPKMELGIPSAAHGGE